MPVKPLRPKVLNLNLNPSILTEPRYKNLTCQIAFIIDGDIFDLKENRERCYRANKEEILRRWLEDKENFYQRPLCFWEFESLPPREIVGEEKWWNPIDHHPGQWEISPVKEKDHQYLFRLALLSKAEMDGYREFDREIIFRNQGMLHHGET